MYLYHITKLADSLEGKNKGDKEISMNQVKEGMVIIINGIRYQFGPSLTEVCNEFLPKIEGGFRPERDLGIHLNREDREGGGIFQLLEIYNALNQA